MNDVELTEEWLFERQEAERLEKGLSRRVLFVDQDRNEPNVETGDPSGREDE